MERSTTRHALAALAATCIAAFVGFWIGHVVVGFAPPPPVEALVIAATPAPGHVVASLATPHEVIDGATLPLGTEVRDEVLGWPDDGSFSTTVPRTGPVALAVILATTVALVGALLVASRAEWSPPHVP